MSIGYERCLYGSFATPTVFLHRLDGVYVGWPVSGSSTWGPGRCRRRNSEAVERLVVGVVPEEMAEYVRAYSQPGALRGAFNDYRAGAEDLAQDLADADRLIDCPTLTLWGADFELVGKMFDVLDVWRGMAHHVRGVAIPQCGHLPQEEQPQLVNRELLAFLDGWNG